MALLQTAQSLHCLFYSAPVLHSSNLKLQLPAGPVLLHRRRLCVALCGGLCLQEHVRMRVAANPRPLVSLYQIIQTWYVIHLYECVERQTCAQAWWVWWCVPISQALIPFQIDDSTNEGRDVVRFVYVSAKACCCREKNQVTNSKKVSGPSICTRACS